MILLPRYRRFGGGGPSLSLDFSSGALDPRITLTRAGATATYFDNTGTLQTAAANAPRFDYDQIALTPKGLLIEESRINSIRNNTMQGASIGTPGTMPTNWVQSQNTGITGNVVGVGVDQGISYIDLQFSGTTAGGTNNNIFFETIAGVAAASGQTWTLACFYKLVGGSLNNISNLSAILVGTNGSTTTESFPLLIPNPSAVWQRGVVTGTLANAGTTNVRPSIQLVPNAAPVAINITIRIGMPQMEQGAFATSVIPTSGAAVTRNVDVASMSANPWYTQGEGTVITEFIPEGLSADAVEAQIDDGTSNNRVVLDYIPTSFARTIVGGVNQHNIVGAVLVAGARYKHAFGIAATNAKAAVNGTLYGPSTASIPTALTVLRLGGGPSGGAALNGWLSRFSYYNTRLPDAQLQALTQAGLPLDILASAAFGYSYRRLRAPYVGKAATIQRDNDSAIQDIGFKYNDFDGVSYNTFAGANTARTIAWPDQSNSNNTTRNAAAPAPVTFSHVPDDHGRYGGFTTGGSLSYMSAPDNANMQNIFATGGFLIVVYRNESEASTGAIVSKGSTAGWEINVFNSGGTWYHVWYIKGATTDGFWLTNEQISNLTLHVVTVAYNASTPTTPPVITLDGVTCTFGTVQNPVGAVMNDTGQPLVMFNNNVSDALNNALAGGVYEAMAWKSIPAPDVQAALISNVKTYYGIP